MTRTEKGCWTATALGVLAAASPFLVEMLTGRSRDWFPLLFITALLWTIIAGTIAVVMRFHHGGREALISGRALLVHWTYPDHEWRRFVELENVHLDEVSRGPIRVVFAMLVAGIGVSFLLGHGTGMIVAPILGTILVASIALMLFAPRIRGRALAPAPGRTPEVHIGTGGLLRCREFHRWSGLGAALETAAVAPGQPAHLVITYSHPSGNARLTTTVRVPIPPGREAEADRVVATLSAPGSCLPP